MLKQRLKKEYAKFLNKSWFGKFTDLLFALLLILFIIPGSRKELMTYGAKIRMYLTSVDKMDKAVDLKGAGNLRFADNHGNSYSLNNFFDKPVFINFWATWCPPCRAEMPAIENLYQQYGEDMHFLLISSQNLEKQADYLNQYSYELPTYRLISEPSGSFNFSVLPTTLIISGEQQIVLRKKGAVNWQSRSVKKLIRELIQ